jgi:hypothetical protein
MYLRICVELLTASKKLNPSWWVDSSSANQNGSSFLWNLKVHYHCYNKLPFVLILESNSATFPYFLMCILILSSLLCLGFQNDLFPARFPSKTLYQFLFSLISAICLYPFQFSLFDHPNDREWPKSQKISKFIHNKIPGKFVYYLMDLQKQYMCGHRVTELGTTLYTLKRYKYEQTPLIWDNVFI